MFFNLQAVTLILPVLAVLGTKRPIIGILSQEDNERVNESTIAASYVKMVEASGARVVPIFIGRPISYYAELMKQINGVVFPGGDADIYAKNGYGDAGRIIYNTAIQMNQQGDQFPILGVCLGHELLAAISSDMQAVLTSCKGVDNVSLPLHFVTNPLESRLFKRARIEDLEVLKKKPVTANHHSECVTRNTLKKYNLNVIWKVLSVNMASNFTEFISSMEHRWAPFTSIQFHPEKVPFEWIVGENPHFRDAIRVNRIFYDWLIEEARKSNHAFKNEQDELNSLIYNYSPEFTGKSGSSFEQMYFFPGVQNHV